MSPRPGAVRLMYHATVGCDTSSLTWRLRSGVYMPLPGRILLSAARRLPSSNICSLHQGLASYSSYDSGKSPQLLAGMPAAMRPTFFSYNTVPHQGIQPVCRKEGPWFNYIEIFKNTLQLSKAERKATKLSHVDS